MKRKKDHVFHIYKENEIEYKVVIERLRRKFHFLDNDVMVELFVVICARCDVP